MYIWTVILLFYIEKQLNIRAEVKAVPHLV
jgi:hypothetical protein